MCGKFKIHNDAPILKYCQKSLNGCCFSGLASDFTSIKKIKAYNAILLHIEESLNSKVGNPIDFANAIMINGKKCEPELYCILSKYKKKGSYDIFTDNN